MGKTCVCMNGLAPRLDHFETEEERTPKCRSEYNFKISCYNEQIM